MTLATSRSCLPKKPVLMTTVLKEECRCGFDLMLKECTAWYVFLYYNVLMIVDVLCRSTNPHLLLGNFIGAYCDESSVTVVLQQPSSFIPMADLVHHITTHTKSQYTHKKHAHYENILLITLKINKKVPLSMRIIKCVIKRLLITLKFPLPKLIIRGVQLDLGS